MNHENPENIQNERASGSASIVTYGSTAQSTEAARLVASNNFSVNNQERAQRAGSSSATKTNFIKNNNYKSLKEVGRKPHKPPHFSSLPSASDSSCRAKSTKTIPQTKPLSHQQPGRSSKPITAAKISTRR